jgi:uncharacterized protein YerC
MDRDAELELTFDLINAFRIVKTPAETALLLRDLLTAKEIKNLSKRLRIAKLLLIDKTEREIEKSLHTSFVTITKVRSWLTQGGEGLKSVISKLPPKYNIPKDLPPMPIEFQFPKVILALAQYAAARNQNMLLEKFEEGVKSKKNLDKSLQKMFDEYFISRKHT